MTDRVYATPVFGVGLLGIVSKLLAEGNQHQQLSKFLAKEVSDKGLKYIEAGEGIYLYLYDDLGGWSKGGPLPWGKSIKGTPTIGIGYTHFSEGISEKAFVKKYKIFTKENPMPYKTVWALFSKTIKSKYSPEVRKVTEFLDLTQHQFDVLTDVCYNIGIYSILGHPNTLGGKRKPELYGKDKGFLGLAKLGKLDKKTISDFFDNLYLFKSSKVALGIRCRHKGNKELYFSGIYKSLKGNKKTGQCYVDKEIT